MAALNVTALKASGGESDCDQGGGGGRAPLASIRMASIRISCAARRSATLHGAATPHAKCSGEGEAEEVEATVVTAEAVADVVAMTAHLLALTTHLLASCGRRRDRNLSASLAPRPGVFTGFRHVRGAQSEHLGIADKFRFDPTDPTESLTMIGPDRACITIRVGLPHLWVLNFSASGQGW